MPIYDYRCDHCGHVFSAVQSFSDEAVAACPNCGKRPRRLITTPAIVFKGSGWYKTDSRAAPPSAAGSSGSDGAKGAAKDEGGSGAKADGGTDKGGSAEKGGGAEKKGKPDAA